jgi:DnaJ-domain-containing protein 1
LPCLTASDAELDQEREAERWRQRQRKWASKQSEERKWWSVLEVSPCASADEIRRSYLRKIKQAHPDRVVGLAPELLPLAEGRAKALNAAYAEAIRAGGSCRNSG